MNPLEALLVTGLVLIGIGLSACTSEPSSPARGGDAGETFWLDAFDHDEGGFRDRLRRELAAVPGTVWVSERARAQFVVGGSGRFVEGGFRGRLRVTEAATGREIWSVVRDRRGWGDDMAYEKVAVAFAQWHAARHR